MGKFFPNFSSLEGITEPTPPKIHTRNKGSSYELSVARPDVVWALEIASKREAQRLVVSATDANEKAQNS